MPGSFRFESTESSPRLSPRDQAFLDEGWTGKFENGPILNPETNIETIYQEILQLPGSFSEKISHLQDYDRELMKQFVIRANKLSELTLAYIAYTKRHTRQENPIINPQTVPCPHISKPDIPKRYIELKESFENAMADINQEGQSLTKN